MGKEEQLLDNITEYLESAKDDKAKGRINSALTLIFKAMSVMTDLFILKEEGYIPSNHSERFRVLETKYPDLYKILDKDFPVYQSSYRIKLTAEHLKVFEDDLKRIIGITGIKVSY